MTHYLDSKEVLRRAQETAVAPKPSPLLEQYIEEQKKNEASDVNKLVRKTKTTANPTTTPGETEQVESDVRV